MPTTLGVAVTGKHFLPAVGSFLFDSANNNHAVSSDLGLPYPSLASMAIGTMNFIDAGKRLFMLISSLTSSRNNP